MEVYADLDAESRVVAAAEREANALASAAEEAERALAEAEEGIRATAALRLEVEARVRQAEGDRETAQRRLDLLLNDLVSTARPRWLSLLVGGTPTGPTREGVRAAQEAVARQEALLERLAADLESLALRAEGALARRDEAASALVAAQDEAVAAGRELAAVRTASASRLATLRDRRDALEREAEPAEILAARGPRWEPPLDWPLKGSLRLTSKYGMRVHPISGVYKTHHGQDIGAPSGTPVYAAEFGRVTFVGTNGGYGKLVIIEHANGRSTRYAHNSKILVDNGQVVRRGDRIALVGSTGASTAPHVHFEVRLNGESEQPRNFLPPPP